MSYTDFRIHEIRVAQIHRRPTRPKIRVGPVLHVLHGSGAYARVVVSDNGEMGAVGESSPVLRQ